MICQKIKRGFNQCGGRFANKWIQRVVLINKQDIEIVERTNFGILFKTRDDFDRDGQVGGLGFDYTKVIHQVLGNVEIVEKFNYNQYRHNVQLPLINFDNLDVLEQIYRSEYFAALIDNQNIVWIFGFDYGLKADDHIFQHVSLDTFTLRSRELEDRPPLKYLGNSDDFWDDFVNIDMPEKGSFNDDFNNDFDNIGS